MNAVNGFLYERTESDQESKDNVELRNSDFKQKLEVLKLGNCITSLVRGEISSFPLQNCTESVSLTLPGSLLLKHLLH